MTTPYANTFLPGAGDTFASALCGKLVSGVPFLRAAGEALRFTYRSVLATIPTDIRYGLASSPSSAPSEAWQRVVASRRASLPRPTMGAGFFDNFTQI